mgnify:CR=1 FL=1
MAKEELECSFCGRKKPVTNLLIAGLDAHICDRCIEQAHGIVLEESKESDGSDLSAELKLRKPLQIKEFLDGLYGQSRTPQHTSRCDDNLSSCIGCHDGFDHVGEHAVQVDFAGIDFSYDSLHFFE